MHHLQSVGEHMSGRAKSLIKALKHVGAASTSLSKAGRAMGGCFPPTDEYPEFDRMELELAKYAVYLAEELADE